MKCAIMLKRFQRIDKGTKSTIFVQLKFVILAYVMYNILDLLQRLSLKAYDDTQKAMQKTDSVKCFNSSHLTKV